VNVTERT